MNSTDVLKLLNDIYDQGCIKGGGHFFKPDPITKMLHPEVKELPTCRNCGAFNARQ